MGTNATASLTEQTILDGNGGEGQFLFDGVGADPQQPSIGADDAPVYLYKHFRTFVSESSSTRPGKDEADADTDDRLDISPTSSVSLELQTGGLDFSGASNSVDSTTYKTTINGNVDAFIKWYKGLVNEQIDQSNAGFVTEAGDVEKWHGGLNKEKVMEALDETIKLWEEAKK